MSLTSDPIESRRTGPGRVYCAPRAATSIRRTKRPLAFAVGATLNRFVNSIRLSHIALAAFIILAFSGVAGVRAQEFLPPAPSDRTLIYTLNGENKLTPLPFEGARTPLKVAEKAKSTKMSYIEISGEHAITTLPSTLRIFLFTKQAQGTHPPFIVWLTPKGNARRATAITQAGMAGLAIASEEIVKPIIRVLSNLGDEVFIELRPRISLVPGEYAIIGDDLTRVATFRVAPEVMR